MCTAGPESYPVNALEAVGSTAEDASCGQTAPSTPSGTVMLDPATTVTICCP